jgi:hypothetical protein
MAKEVIISGRFTLATVDYSAQVESIGLTFEKDAPEVTNMDSAAWREFLSGLKSYQVRVNMKRDADLSGFDSAVFGFFNGTATTPFTIKHKSGTTAPAIPEWQGNLIVNQYSPIDQAVGEAYAGSFTWQGTGAITRATS